MIFAILLVIVVSGVIYFILKKNRKVQKLRTEYEEALQGQSKELALAAAKAYFVALRGYDQLTTLDEMQLAKDVAAMK